MDINALIKQYFDELNIVREPKNLYEPIAYALNTGGKRVRPALVLMAAELFGKDAREVLAPAAAMEIFHNFTLLHDDVMDNAETRRNRATVHEKWNNNTAILSGDAMLIEAYKQIVKVPEDKLSQVLELFSQTAIEVCEGQQYDVDFESRFDVEIEEYYTMIRLKTAVLLAACLKLGAILAEASDEDAQAIYDFGIAIGIAFQLKDDYLDTYGDEKTFGKKIGGDIASGKRSFLLVSTLKLCSKSQCQTIKQLLDVENHIRNEEKIIAIVDIYDKLGVSNICQEEMEKYYNQALECLNRINKTEEELATFVNFAKKLMGRNV